MKHLKILGVVVALTATALFSAPARANHTYVPPVDRSSLPALAGRTTVIGNDSGWQRVRLPEAIDVNELFMDIDWDVEGRGRIIAMFLLREVDGEIPRRGKGLGLMRFGNCAHRGCNPDRWASPWGFATTTKDGDLPPGIYRLYLVADGAPASVYLEIEELSGVTRLNPDRDVQAKVHTMTSHLEESNTGIVFSAGDQAPFRGRGIALQGQWIDPIGAGAIEYGWCLYPRRAPRDPGTAYLPPRCDTPYPSPWMLWGLQRYTPLSDSCCYGFQLAVDFLPRAMGNWYTATGPVEKYGAAALWLKF